MLMFSPSGKYPLTMPNKRYEGGPLSPQPLSHLTSRTLPLYSPRTPLTSRSPRASTTPSPHYTNFSPADKSPRAAPPDSPTSPACSSAPSPPSTNSSASTNPPTSKSTSRPGAASECHQTKYPQRSQTSHRSMKSTRQLACLGRAPRHANMFRNNLQLPHNPR